MNPAEDSAATAPAVRRRARAARERAARAQANALAHERLGAGAGDDFHGRMAALHRQVAACHLAAAQLHDAFARRLEPPGKGVSRPHFMAGVAEACGTGSAALTLLGPDRAQLAVAASDETARSAQDLEFVLGEGPARDAALGQQVRAAGAVLAERWPRYGAAVEELGLHSVVAVPLSAQDGCIGALTVFDPSPGLLLGLGSTGLSRIADALVKDVLMGPDADPGLYGDTDFRPEVHQAAGMLAERTGCDVGDALALMRARAFRDGTTIESVAVRIHAGELELG
ncbi:GAF and ANTAR domain-containing protein [Streptomyces sp. NPDC051940]|uniref:GAF and ANTAR domain-containing protein n=1 Tax=Streptomyces sp. NPDC051940 TaxID=3155675 RepID=UPI0034266FE3